jgi:hypothetical protein
MKKIFLIFCLGKIAITSYSQINYFVGVWREVMQDTNSYRLITDNYFYSFYDVQDSNDWYIKTFYYGFIDDKDSDSVSISQFKDIGEHFVLAEANLDKEKVYDKDYFLIYGTNIHSKYADFTAIDLEGPKVFMYTKIFKLNKKLEENLKEKSPDVFVEYLKITSQLEIYSKKCTVYSEPNRPTKAQLQKGDIVMIIEEQDNWLKIEYGENDIGWIKRKDVKYNNNFIKRDK